MASGPFGPHNPLPDRSKSPGVLPVSEPEEYEAAIVDPVVNWRFDALVAAGFELRQALDLATNRTIDLYEATNLAQKAGPETAYRILR